MARIAATIVPRPSTLPRTVDAARGAVAAGLLGRTARLETWQRVALLVMVLGGAFLRAYRLDSADLWLDEANTVLVVSQPLGGMLTELATGDVHPPLFYLLERLPLALAWTELGLRALPWLCGVLSIPALFVVARSLGSWRTGLAAAGLCAVSAPLVLFSQEGRMYSLLALLELIATWVLIRGLEEGGRRWWASFALASAAALYTHNLAGLFLLAHLLVPFWVRRGVRPALVASGAVLLVYLPWLPEALQQTSSVSRSGGWLGGAPPLWLPAITLVNLLGGAELRDGLLSPRFAIEHPSLLGAALALLLLGWRRLGARPVARRALLCTLLLPIVLALLISQVTRVYVDKTFLVDALLLIIVMARAVPDSASVQRLAGPLLALVLLGVAEAWAVAASWSTPHEQYHALVGMLREQRLAGDELVAVPYFLARPVGYYLRRAGDPSVVRAVPLGQASEVFATRSDRLWVVSGGPWLQAEGVDALHSPSYRLVWEQTYPDASLRLMLFVRQGV